MKKSEALECLHCGNVFEKDDKKCPKCSANIETMIPQKKPKYVNKPKNYDWRIYAFFAILSSPVIIPLSIHASVTILEPEIQWYILIQLTFYIILYFIIRLYHFYLVKKYVRYKRKVKLYRTFVKSIEEENKENMNGKRCSYNQLVKKYGRLIESYKVRHGRHCRWNVCSYDYMLFRKRMIVLIDGVIEENIDLSQFKYCEFSSKTYKRIEKKIKEPKNLRDYDSCGTSYTILFKSTGIITSFFMDDTANKNIVTLYNCGAAREFYKFYKSLCAECLR